MSNARYNLFPSKPSFHAYRSDDYNINVSGQHRIVRFNAVAHNEGNHWSDTTDLFTAPVNGVYQFNATVRINNQNSGTYMILKMYKNPTFSGDQITAGTAIKGMYSISTNMGSYNTRQLSLTIKLSANDTVCVSAYSQGDTSWGIDNNSQFSGHLVT